MAEIDGGLSRILREFLPGPHWQRIETALTGLGIPDMNACHGGREVWIELKQTSGWKPAIRPEQGAWAWKRYHSGGHVFLATRRRTDGGPRSAAADELWVHRGDQIIEVRKLGLREGPAPLLRLEGGPSRWNWDAVRQLWFPGT